MQYPQPPSWIDKFLSKWIHPDLQEGILGDLYEKYLVVCESKGNKSANWIYFLNAIGYLRYFNLKSQNSNSNWKAMFKNHLTITLRTLKKHRTYAAINIIGLAIGLAAGFMILQHVYYEMSFDSFFANKENIYRLKQNRYNKGELTTEWAGACAGVGPAMQTEFPEVQRYVRLTKSNTMLSFDQRFFKVDNAYYASEEFFKIFSVPLISGIDSSVLKKPYTVVLSQSLATKIFSDEDPLGRIVNLNGKWDFTVTGVYEDLPDNTHMALDLLYSYESYVDIVGEDARTEWNWDGYLTYIQVHPDTDIEVLQSKFPPIIEKYNGEELKRYDSSQSFELQPLEDIHLTSHYISEFKTNGQQRTTYLLLIVGVLVLVIAWINYINLSTARSMQRAKEVGVRKVVGSSKKQLVYQFMFESLFTNVLSVSLSVIFIFLAYPYFSHFVGRNEMYTIPSDIHFWVPFLSMILIGTVLSGFYPAVVLTRYKPIIALTGKLQATASGSLLRKGLVIFQFIISVLLITGTFVIYNQIQFLQQQDLGVAIDQTLIIRTPVINADSVYEGKYDVFKSYLLNESEIKKMSATNTVPGRRAYWNAGGIRLLHQNESEANQYRIIAMDDQFIDLFELEVIEGRAFDDSYGNETASVMLNEAAVPMLGAMSPGDLINKKMFFWGDTFNIVGVVRNFRQESPKAAFDPMVFRYYKTPKGFYAAQVSTDNMSRLIDKVQEYWNITYTDQPMDFFFLDDYYNEQYQSEQKFGTIFGGFALLAIIVACMGLFGLASFTTSLRTKEVSVRKVLGATFPQLFMLLVWDFLKLVSVAIVLSVPFSWMVLNDWLQGFANRIDLQWHLFLMPAVLLLIISLLTIGYHTYRTVVVNPSRTLKYE